MRAIVLAAGLGSRLGAGVPKPLAMVAGGPLLQRTIESLAAGGAREVVVVVGYEGDRIREAIAGWATPVPVRFRQNDRWKQSNGLSVLAAAEVIEHGTMLSMSDHLLSADLVARVAAWSLAEGEAVLGVDRDVPGCFDLPDATKVRLEGDRIVDIGKELAGYDCVDCGVFAVSPALFDALDEARARRGGDCALSDGVRTLAQRRRARVLPIGDAFWQDVDTPGARDRAEGILGK